MRILFEPGRFMVGNAGVLLSTVQYVKETPAKTFTIVDAAMNDLIRPALYEGYHEIVPLRERSDGEHLVMDVVGPVCESGDFFAQDREVPRLCPGRSHRPDERGRLRVRHVLHLQLPAALARDPRRGGPAHVVRRRQTYADLVEGESVP